MKSERDWRIIPVLLTALSRARLARSAFLLFFTPLRSAAPFRIYGRAHNGLFEFHFIPWLRTAARSPCITLAISYPRPSFRPSTSLTACTISLRPFPPRPCSLDRSHDTQIRRTNRRLKSIESIIINEINLQLPEI